jgi:uncharacterized membrane protein
MWLPPLATKLFNIAIYQTGWFCCVLGAAWGFPIAGALMGLLLAGLHLLLATSWKNEALLMLAACLLGIVVDSIQQALGLFTFTRNPVWPFWLPLWVFVIWAQFATLFHYALHWLSGRYLLAAMFGLIGGPLAYWAGIRIGAASFGDNPNLTVMVLAMVWALVTPLLCRLSDALDIKEGRYRLGRDK